MGITEFGLFNGCLIFRLCDKDYGIELWMFTS